jgi:hypothetical protein
MQARFTLSAPVKFRPINKPGVAAAADASKASLKNFLLE